MYQKTYADGTSKWCVTPATGPEFCSTSQAEVLAFERGEGAPSDPGSGGDGAISALTDAAKAAVDSVLNMFKPAAPKTAAKKDYTLYYIGGAVALFLLLRK